MDLASIVFFFFNFLTFTIKTSPYISIHYLLQTQFSFSLLSQNLTKLEASVSLPLLSFLKTFFTIIGYK